MPYEWPIADGAPERFWEKVDVRGEEDCWLWLAYRNPSGYGMFQNSRPMSLAHRFAYALHHAHDIAGAHVLHDCDNRACVNPRHLYLGTNADNVRDKVQRGRSSFSQPRKRGESHPLAKLTRRDVAQIRRLRGRVSGRELARRYGVHPSTVCLIQKGTLWATR